VAPRRIAAVLRQLAKDAPERPLVTCGGDTVTRAEFERCTNRLARAYSDLGVGFGDRVTIGLPNGIGFLEACFATWKLGATPQPVSWRLPAPERRSIIGVARPALLVGLGHAEIPAVDAGFVPDPALPDGPLEVDLVSPSLRAMTSSGSTGAPKLIVSTLPATFDAETVPYGMAPHHVRLVPGPLYHAAPFSATAGVLLGQHVVVLERFDADVAVAAIEEHRVDYVQLVPTMMHRIVRRIDETGRTPDLSSLEAVWHLGASCPPWLKERWLDLVGPDRLFELYGGTEAQAITVVTGREWMDHRGTVGRVAHGEMVVLRADGSPAPPGEIGEIYMRRGPGLEPTYRYVGAAPRRSGDGWDSLGDLGWFDEQGYLYLADRRTDMIASGGANVYPAEVEAALLEHPSVGSAVVVGLPDDDLGRRVHAVVQAPDHVDTDDLREHLMARLTPYKVPRSFRIVDHDLRDESGKVRRSAVRADEVRRERRCVPQS
jgi:bile acid-coenzyme A ligase